MHSRRLEHEGGIVFVKTSDSPLRCSTLPTLPTLPQLFPRTDTVRMSNGRQQETMFVGCPLPAFPGKPRFAPPQSTRAIRAGRQPRPTHGMDQLTHAPKAERNLSSVVSGKAEGEGFNDRERANCRGMARAANPAERRRVLMTRMGQGFGFDLSSAINALLLEQQGNQQVSLAVSSWRRKGDGEGREGGGEGKVTGSREGRNTFCESSAVNVASRSE